MSVVTAVVVLFITSNPFISVLPCSVPTCKVSVESSCATAFILLLDTFKNPLIDIFPGLEPILFNLYETLKDIKLFIIDLY